MANVKPIPEGFHSVTPYIVVRGAAKAIEFYQKAFGAKERYRMPMPDGSIGHAEIQIGNSIVMLADEMPSYPSPETLNGSPTSFVMYVEDADAAFQTAVQAGAQIVRPLTNEFYGARTGMVRDPFGHVWSLMTQIEELSPEEMEKRMAAEAAKRRDKPQS